MKPADVLKYTKRLYRQMTVMRKQAVFVGLPKEKIGDKVYGDGNTVLRIGAIHEYGLGNNPRRSFLRVPFALKRDELNKVIAKQFKAVSDGLDVNAGLFRIGAAATNVSKGAFISKGYGTWADIDPATKNRKGSSQVLIDTGILRSSVQFVVRKNAT